MKKLVLMCAACLCLSLLAGCENSYNTINFPVLPDELKDCKFFHVENSSGAHVCVVRCPNSTTSTTYTAGKMRTTSVVIDGVEYTQK